MSRGYYRIMLGARSAFAQTCHDEGWFGGGWDIAQDLTGQLLDNYWREFNAKFIPVYLQASPGKSRVAAGLACGMLHTTSKGRVAPSIDFYRYQVSFRLCRGAA